MSIIVNYVYKLTSCSCHLLSQMFPLASSYHVIPTSTRRKLWKVPTGHSTRCHLRSSGEANEKKTDSSFYSSDLKKPIEKNIPLIRENSSTSIKNNHDYHDISWLYMNIIDYPCSSEFFCHLSSYDLGDACRQRRLSRPRPSATIPDTWGHVA